MISVFLDRGRENIIPEGGGKAESRECSEERQDLEQPSKRAEDRGEQTEGWLGRAGRLTDVGDHTSALTSIWVTCHDTFSAWCGWTDSS